MPKHTFSTVVRDITWSNIGNGIDTLENISAVSGLDINARYDTSGGTVDDGTTYQTEGVLTAEYEYSLGNGDVALDDMADALSQLSITADKTTLKSEIKSRG